MNQRRTPLERHGMWVTVRWGEELRWSITIHETAVRIEQGGNESTCWLKIGGRTIGLPFDHQEALRILGVE